MSAKRASTVLVFGRSVLDILVPVGAEEPPPFKVDVAKYIDEVFLGINGAPSVANGQLSEDKAFRRLSTVLRSTSAATANCCKMLLWIGLLVIFRRGGEEALRALRVDFSRSWHLVLLDIGKVCAPKRGGLETGRDALLSALPVVMVQAVYRLLVDSFPADRHLLVQFSERILDKLAHVANHEIIGFMRSAELYRKERRQMFQERIIQTPDINLFEAQKNEKRLEFLEKQNDVHGPLTFGQMEAQPLEDLQLEYILHGRQERREKGSASTRVELQQYVALVEEGETLSMRQAAEMGTDILETCSNDSEDHVQFNIEVVESLPPSGFPSPCAARSSVSPLGSMNATGPSRRTICGDSPGPGSQQGSSFGFADTSRSWRSSKRGDASKTLRKRKETQAHDRRRREDLVKQHIIGELPSQFLQRRVDTSWVSPAMDRLAPGEGERNCLQKRATDARRVQMDSPKSAKQLLPRLSGSASAPALGTSAREKSKSKAQRLPALGGTAKLEDSCEAISLMKSSRKVSHTKVGERPMSHSRQVNLDPSGSLASTTVKQRLESQQQAFVTSSFDHYMKEFDVVSGKRKTRQPEGWLHREESACLAKTYDLIGEKGTPALRCCSSITLQGLGAGGGGWSLTAVPRI